MLTEPFLHADFGRNWVMKAPVRFVNMALNGVRKYLDEQVVVLIMMLTHPVNVGYAPHSFKHLQVCATMRVCVWVRGGCCVRARQLLNAHAGPSRSRSVAPWRAHPHA